MNDDFLLNSVPAPVDVCIRKFGPLASVYELYDTSVN